MTADAFRILLEEVIHDPKFQPCDGTTFCNMAVQKVCNAFDVYDLDGMMANQMVAALEAGMLKGWAACTAQEATRHALDGGLALAGKQYVGHGHIAVVWPGSMDFAGSYGKEVPMLANVGSKNGVLNLGWVFAAKKGEPGYWKFTQGA